ncbi:MAG: hypothetical protein ACTSX7_11305 [Alphaproteobacteria bacterium]
MSPTIRIDDEVYAWLQAKAVPFDDTPNSVLRRIADFNNTEGEPKANSGEKAAMTRPARTSSARRSPMTSGPQLIKRWSIPVRQARFHRDGVWYEHLTQFPAAFCDPDGYVVFETREEYRTCQRLNLGKQVNVPGGISSIPDYKSVDDRLS